ncbi:unnamed protein product [marine sediment metagenome]|uniref:Uncharacterized protein n=1 Tax=marine sediment metagenome TaxID=412755 RepID=X0WT22_9ZZZZ
MWWLVFGTIAVLTMYFLFIYPFYLIAKWSDKRDEKNKGSRRCPE